MTRPPEEAESSISPVTALRQVTYVTWRHPRASKPKPARSKLPLAPSAQWVTYCLQHSGCIPCPQPPRDPNHVHSSPCSASTWQAGQVGKYLGSVPSGSAAGGGRGREEGGEESAQNRNHRGPLRQPCRSRGPAARCPPSPPVSPALHVVRARSRHRGTCQPTAARVPCCPGPSPWRPLRRRGDSTPERRAVQRGKAPPTRLSEPRRASGIIGLSSRGAWMSMMKHKRSMILSYLRSMNHTPAMDS